MKEKKQRTTRGEKMLVLKRKKLIEKLKYTAFLKFWKNLIQREMHVYILFPSSKFGFKYLVKVCLKTFP